MIGIAEFREQDADELVPMWRESFEAGAGIVDPHPLQEQREYLLKVVVPENRVRVARLEGLIVGFVAATSCSVAQLHVRRGFQRRGIGRHLLEWAKGQSSGSLWLYTFARNAGARAFYERNGFRIVSRGFEPHWQLEDIKYEWVREAGE